MRIPAMPPLLGLVLLAIIGLPVPLCAAETEAAIQPLIPDIETYVAAGMKQFDVPGAAIGIVADDRLIYAKGFGVRGKSGGQPVGPRTVFQIGSATKAFLGATMAIMVDRGKLHWGDRVVDLDPGFQMRDPWVTREFRVFDLIAQRSGLPPYANDGLGMFGFDESHLIHSLRDVAPVSSFRSTFAYTNMTHVLAGRVVARAADAPDWNAVLRQTLLEPLGMADSSTTAAAIEAAPDHAEGHRWTPRGSVEIPFTQIFPYDFGGAGDINSTVEDVARWVRMQLGDGEFEGRRIVSAENLAYTHTPKVAITDKISYALGWIVQQTPNGAVIWHNGGTSGFGAYVGLVPARHVGVIVLSNETNIGFPDQLGLWISDRVLGNPRTDRLPETLKSATARFEKSEKQFARPASPQPPPDLAGLAGTYVNPSFGKVVVAQEGEGLIMNVSATGAQLRLAPRDGDTFTATLLPEGRFRPLVESLGPSPMGFVEARINAEGQRRLLRLIMEDGQGYTFRRE